MKKIPSLLTRRTPHNHRSPITQCGSKNLNIFSPLLYLASFSTHIMIINRLARFILLAMLLTLSGCSLVTVPVKVVGKVATTTIGLAGKAAGAGINALRKDDDDSKDD